MDEKVCAFTGHRPDKLPWGYCEDDPRCSRLKYTLRDVITALAEGGVTLFVGGMALGCDLYFAEAVLSVREDHPEIAFEAAVPFRGQADHWQSGQKERYGHILSLADTVTVLREEYTRDCLLRRNRYMVDKCSLLLACYDGSVSGGTFYTMNYAKKQGREVIILPVEK